MRPDQVELSIKVLFINCWTAFRWSKSCTNLMDHEIYNATGCYRVCDNWMLWILCWNSLFLNEHKNSILFECHLCSVTSFVPLLLFFFRFICMYLYIFHLIFVCCFCCSTKKKKTPFSVFFFLIFSTFNLYSTPTCGIRYLFDSLSGFVFFFKLRGFPLFGWFYLRLPSSARTQ